MRIEIEWDALTAAERRPAPGVGKPQGIYVPVTYPARGQNIWDCRNCIGWSAHVDVQDGQVVIVEWHQEGCELAVGLCHVGMPAGRTCEYCGAVNVERCHGELAAGVICGVCGTYNADEPVEGDPE